MFAYGTAADALDEGLNLSGTVIARSLFHFVEAIIKLFENQYSREPNEEDIECLVKAKMLPEVFQACSGQLTACTGGGRTVLWRGVEHFKGKSAFLPSLLKL
jgi:hypothetical protein